MRLREMRAAPQTTDEVNLLKSEDCDAYSAFVSDKSNARKNEQRRLPYKEIL